jgi:8-oxo-dGTP diphosphatase
MRDDVRAAGGLVLRQGCVLLVHRPAYGDWTFPKGKLERGESWQEAARRELEEETGLTVELGAEVGRTFYRDASGREKEVRYYLAASDAEPAAQNEVDDVRFVPLAEAGGLLTYRRDRQLIRRLAGGA